MLFEIISESQLLLSKSYSKYLEKENADVLYENMLREEEKNAVFLEQEKQLKELEKIRIKEDERKKRENMIGLINMNEDKENELRTNWLNERKEDDSNSDDEKLDETLKNESDFGTESINLTDQECLIINLVKTLSFFISKVKNTNFNELLELVLKILLLLYNLILFYSLLKLLKRPIYLKMMIFTMHYKKNKCLK